MGRDTDRLIIELPRNSNLDVVLRMFIATLGSGVQAIALALSTPHDNSEEVQKQIDKYADEIRSIRTDLAQSVNNQTGGN